MDYVYKANNYDRKIRASIRIRGYSFSMQYFVSFKSVLEFKQTMKFYRRGPLHHSETHIIKNTVTKQSKGLNCDLKPEHKKTTNRATMNPTSVATDDRL